MAVGRLPIIGPRNDDLAGRAPKPGDIVYVNHGPLRWAGYGLVYRVHEVGVELTGEDGERHAWRGRLPVLDVIVVHGEGQASVVERVAAMDDIRAAIHELGMPETYYGPLIGYRIVGVVGWLANDAS